jgi:hypothetical protein
MQKDPIETGWREFLDRLKRFWGKPRGGAATPAVLSARACSPSGGDSRSYVTSRKFG